MIYFLWQRSLQAITIIFHNTEFTLISQKIYDKIKGVSKRSVKILQGKLMRVNIL